MSNKNLNSHQDEKATLSIRIQPNASKNQVVGRFDEAIRIKITAPPVEDKANKECLKFLSDILRVPKTSISIIKGHKTRSKMIQVLGMSSDMCLQRLISQPRGERAK